MTTYDPPRPWTASYAEGVPADLPVISGSLVDIIDTAAREDAAAIDALLLDPARAANPQAVWAELEPVAGQVGLHFQAFQLATTRVCERLNMP